MTPPTLQTERLTLGALTPSHVEAFAAFVATEHSAFLGGPGDREDAWVGALVHAGQWVVRGYGTFWVSETATGTPVGRVGIWHPDWLPEPELSWAIYEGHVRRGCAVEAARAARAWAREARGLDGLWSLVKPANEPSRATARALGARQEGTHAYRDGSVAEVWRHPRGLAA